MLSGAGEVRGGLGGLEVVGGRGAALGPPVVMELEAAAACPMTHQGPRRQSSSSPKG